MHNGERWLAEAVESILGQTLADLELIAVDDGSTDGSRAILERFAACDQRVRVLANDSNEGSGAASNRGRREARAPYLAHLDHDDVALASRLERQAAFLDASPSVAAVGGRAFMTDASGNRGPLMRVPTDPAAIRSLLPRRNCLLHSSVMMRRSAVEAVGGYRVNLVGDWDLWLRLGERYDLANLAEPVILYRFHGDQISSSMLGGRIRTTGLVLASARARRTGGHDPLLGVSAGREEASAAHPHTAEVQELADRARLARAVLLSGFETDDARELVAEALAPLDGRARRVVAAARELTRAEALRAEGRRLAAAARVAGALRREPRYTAGRIGGWTGARMRRGSGRASSRRRRPPVSL